MDIPEQLHCQCSASITEQDGSYVVDVPEEEIHFRNLQEDETYRIALLPMSENDDSVQSDAESTNDSSPPTPPVQEGDTRTLEIVDIGDQGDGIARVERGFVVIVPDTERGEKVTVEITDVRETVAFADLLKRVSYYD